MSWNYEGCFCLKHRTRNITCKECDEAYELRDYVLTTILKHLTPKEKAECWKHSDEEWERLYWKHKIKIKDSTCYNQPPSTKQTLAIIRAVEKANNEYLEKVQEALGKTCGDIHYKYGGWNES